MIGLYLDHIFNDEVYFGIFSVRRIFNPSFSRASICDRRNNALCGDRPSGHLASFHIILRYEWILSNNKKGKDCSVKTSKTLRNFFLNDKFCQQFKPKIFPVCRSCRKILDKIQDPADCQGNDRRDKELEALVNNKVRLHSDITHISKRVYFEHTECDKGRHLIIS